MTWTIRYRMALGWHCADVFDEAGRFIAGDIHHTFEQAEARALKRAALLKDYPMIDEEETA